MWYTTVLIPSVDAQDDLTITDFNQVVSATCKENMVLNFIPFRHKENIFLVRIKNAEI